MKSKYLILLGIIAIFSPFVSKGQVDPHLSQYYANPMWLNPAMTGLVDGDLRVVANQKGQWGSITKPFTTSVFSIDLPINQLGVGFTILNQSAGDADFNYLTALASVSYNVRFGQSGFDFLSFGVQGGIINKSFDASKIIVGDPGDPNNGGESFSNRSRTVPDVNAGVLYFNGNPTTRANLFFGASSAHLSQPNDDFLGTSNQRVNRRYTAHGGVRYKASEAFEITPHALLLVQGKSKEIAAGAYAQYNINPNANLLFGATYRFDDAIIAYTGVQVKDILFGVSYDVNSSPLQVGTNNKGGFEFSLSYVKRKKLPDPKFICPRL